MNKWSLADDHILWINRNAISQWQIEIVLLCFLISYFNVVDISFMHSLTPSITVLTNLDSQKCQSEEIQFLKSRWTFSGSASTPVLPPWFLINYYSFNIFCIILAVHWEHVIVTIMLSVTVSDLYTFNMKNLYFQGPNSFYGH
jgi:hypothetical protein